MTSILPPLHAGSLVTVVPPTLFITFVTDDGEVHMSHFDGGRLFWNSGRSFVVLDGRTFGMNGSYMIYPHIQPALEAYNAMCAGATAARAAKGF